MPIQTLSNSVFAVRDVALRLDDKGYYLTMNINNCDAAVLCISEKGPIRMQNVSITEEELGYLLKGHKVKKEGYVLQGVTRQSMLGTGIFRDFEVSPPSFIQVWGMKEHNLDVNLFVPESTSEQSVPVPQLYRVEIRDNCLIVWIDKVSGYDDGDLLYRIAKHLPIPIPRSRLNSAIPLWQTTDVEVFAAEHVEASYKKILD